MEKIIMLLIAFVFVAESAFVVALLVRMGKMERY